MKNLFFSLLILLSASNSFGAEITDVVCYRVSNERIKEIAATATAEEITAVQLVIQSQINLLALLVEQEGDSLRGSMYSLNISMCRLTASSLDMQLAFKK